MSRDYLRNFRSSEELVKIISKKNPGFSVWVEREYISTNSFRGYLHSVRSNITFKGIQKVKKK